MCEQGMAAYKRSEHMRGVRHNKIKALLLN